MLSSLSNAIGTNKTSGDRPSVVIHNRGAYFVCHSIDSIKIHHDEQTLACFHPTALAHRGLVPRSLDRGACCLLTKGEEGHGQEGDGGHAGGGSAGSGSDEALGRDETRGIQGAGVAEIAGGGLRLAGAAVAVGGAGGGGGTIGQCRGADRGRDSVQVAGVGGLKEPPLCGSNLLVVAATRAGRAGVGAAGEHGARAGYGGGRLASCGPCGGAVLASSGAHLVGAAVAATGGGWAGAIDDCTGRLRVTSVQVAGGVGLKEPPLCVSNLLVVAATRAGRAGGGFGGAEEHVV